MNRLRVSNPLLLMTAVVLMAALALAAWFSAGGSGGGSASAAEDNETLLSAAFGISRHAGSMVASASTPTVDSMTPDTLSRLSDSFEQNLSTLREMLPTLEGRGYDERAARIRQHIDALAANIELINDARPELLGAQKDSQAAHRRLNYEISKPLDAALVTALDDQLSLMVRGGGDSGDPAGWTSNTVTAGEVLLYHYLFNMVEAERTLINKMKGASVSKNPHIVAMIQEDYDSAFQRMTASLDYLARHSAMTLDPDVISLSNEMFELGSGEENIWDKMYLRQERETREQGLIAANQAVLSALLSELDGLVAEVSQ